MEIPAEIKPGKRRFVGLLITGFGRAAIVLMASARRVINRSLAAFTWRPSREFWIGFWPTFWATIIGAILSIPAGLVAGLRIDRVVTQLNAARSLPPICSELKTSQINLRTFSQLESLPADAVGSLGSPLRMISTGFAQTRFRDLDDQTLVGSISNAYLAIDEVNRYLSAYQDVYTASFGERPSEKEIFTRNRLSGTSVEANRKVDYAIKLIAKAERQADCQ